MQLINERQKTHGDFSAVAKTAEELARSTSITGFENPALMHARRMICVKLARITHGDNCCEDHWRDIAGYATLAADILAEPQKKGGAP